MQNPSVPADPGAVTRLLRRIDDGEKSAEAELYTLVEDELRKLASRRLLHQRGDLTLQLTALVHEAWLRMAPQPGGLEGRSHFLGVAARAMRCVLLDRARARRTTKRGGEYVRIALDEVVAVYEDTTGDLLELDSALQRLAELRPRQAKVVELRFFGGLSVEDTAEALGVGRATVMRDWHLARIQLREELAP